MSLNGLLILKGTNNIDHVIRGVVTEVPESICIGDAKTAQVDPADVTSDTPMSEVIFEMQKRVAVKSYSYALWGPKPYGVHVPMRASWVGAWTEGVHDAKMPEQMVDMLLKINRQPWEGEKSNYSNRVAQRVLSCVMTGPSSAMMLYASQRPSIMLRTHDVQLYMWIVVTSNVYFLLWSTDPDRVNKLMASLTTIQQHQILALPIDLDTRSVVTLHPLFLVNKFHNFLSSSRDGHLFMYVLAYMRNYLERKTVNTDTVHNQPTTGGDAESTHEHHSESEGS